MKKDLIEEITFDDKTYVINNFPKDIRDLITIAKGWQSELDTARIEVFKLEAAIRGIEQEIKLRISKLEK